MFDPNQQIAPPMNLSDMFMAQSGGMTPQPMSGAQSPWPAMMGNTQPVAMPQTPQDNGVLQHISDVISQYTQNQQTQQSGNNFITNILANRTQPTAQDTSTSLLNSVLTNSYSSPEQQMAGRYTAQLSPYSDALTMQGKMAQTGLENAQAGYYQNTLQRDLAEKAYQYANDPQMAQSRMMAQYMGNLSGMPQLQNGGQPPDGGMIPDSGAALQLYRQQNGLPTPPIDSQMAAMGRPIGTSAPMNGTLPQQLQSNAQQGGGFNPMGAMLAKSLGLTDMQIGPNGQPMPIPGSMKIENGSVISFDQNGKPQSNIPVNPRAQGLFEQKLQDMASNLEKLHKIGGTIEEDDSFLSNKATQIAASKGNDWMPGGQDILQGTQAQTLRDNIQADVKQALPLYMQAFGITPGMERAQAAQQMLQDAIGGALTKSRQHTLSNLANLSQTAGTGQLAQQINTPQIPTITSPSDPAFQKLPSGSKFMTPEGQTMVKH